ncbi:MAG: prolipoprotein diacylglyceryl transferase [Bacteriovoracaceae bacterium]
MEQTWIDPVVFSVGPFQVRWYGAMYVLGFLLGGLICSKFLVKKKIWPLPAEAIDKYVTWLIIGMFLGARLTYVFVYNWEYYSVNLGDIFSVWKGGLSFHGAVLGMCFVTYLFAKSQNVNFYQISDCLAICGTQGLFWGRMGNFINGELYGRVTDSWVGVVFPGGGPFPRHPSQLYEGVLEGIVLSILIWIAAKKQKYYGVVGAIFVGGYGLMRFIVEFFREPDPQLGYYFGFLTMGQILCLLMLPVAYLVYKHSQSFKIPNPVYQGP